MQEERMVTRRARTTKGGTTKRGCKKKGDMRNTVRVNRSANESPRGIFFKAVLKGNENEDVL